jgi:hypothetical protein
MFERVGSLAERVATNVSRRAFMGWLGRSALLFAGTMGAMLASSGVSQAKGCAYPGGSGGGGGGTHACCCYDCGNGVFISYAGDACQGRVCHGQWKGCTLTLAANCGC